jgi:tRNA(Ile)-lysidine synthase
MIDVALPNVPPGRWAVGVSGGADSVALLLLLHGRPDLSLHVVHLDHETRAGASAADAAFVVELAGRLGLPVTVARLSEVERDPPRNPSARYRAARLGLFRRVVAEHGLAGVVLAHHADDQAETVMLRLLRGGGPRALVGMAARSMFDPGLRGTSDAGVEVMQSSLNGLVVLRPLLGVASRDLRQFLVERGQPWREDGSNASDRYLRNRVRPWLAGDPPLAEALRRLANAARGTRDWLDVRAPALAESFAGSVLAAVPVPVARHAAGRWLVARGVPADGVNRAVCDRLIAMAADAATPGRQTFPGAVSVRRSRGWLAAAASGPRPPGRRCSG